MSTAIVLSMVAAFVSVTAKAGMRGMNAGDVPTDKDGHVLVELWKDYSAAQKADRPQKQLDILQKIKDESSSAKFLWDWYDASRQYVEVSRRRDWKTEESLRAKMEEEIASLGEPVLRVHYDASSYLSPEDRLKFVKDNAKSLKSGCHRQFYKADELLQGLEMHEVLQQKIADDYEYALWSIRCSADDEIRKEVSALLSKHLDGAYPDAQYLEYLDTAKDGLQAFADKYAGKAVSLFAEQDLLFDRFSELNHDQEPSQDAYTELRGRCESFEKKRKAFKADEKALADCCTRVKGLIDKLDGKALSLWTENGTLKAVFRNLDQAKVEIVSEEPDNKGKVVFSTVVRNPATSYYVKDTVTVDLPVFDDGNYQLTGKYGKETTSTFLSKYRLSLLTRKTSSGYAAFAADYKTGKPVDKADLVLYDGDRVLMTVRDFAFDGMTPFSSEMNKAALSVRKNFGVSVSYKGSDGSLCKSQHCRRYVNDDYSDPVYKDQLNAVVMTDRSLYVQGETVSFKAVVVSGNLHTSIAPAESGLPVRAVLKDPENKDIARLDLKTNEFGSVAGDLEITKGGRNGMYSLYIYQGRNVLGQTLIRVEDIVLPTYEIVWDNDDFLHLPGDTLKFSGHIDSYSGHSLSGAKLYAEVSTWGEKVFEREIQPADDGSFVIDFVSKPQGYQYYNCTLKVVDGTGETLDGSSSKTVYESLNLGLGLENRAPCSVREKETNPASSGVVMSDTARVKVNIAARDGLEIMYRLLRAGSVICAGKAGAGEILELPLPGPSGEFDLEVEAGARNAAGMEIKEKKSLMIVKLSESDSSLDADVEHLFCRLQGDDIAFMMGSTNGPTWAVVDIYASPDKLIDSKLVFLGGLRGEPGSLTTIRYVYKKEYGKAVKVSVNYFRNGERYRYDEVFEKNNEDELALPLTFTRFEDRTLPGGSYKFLIGTAPESECVASIFDKSTETVMPDIWNRVRMLHDISFRVNYSVATGGYDSPYFWGDDIVDEMVVIGYGSSRKNKLLSSNAKTAPILSDQMELVEEEAIPFQLASGAAVASEVTVREDFAKTIAFEPFLRSDADGVVELPFTNGDKLSTFIVQLFAHDKKMRNNVLRREMVVTIPVKVAVVEPKVLYEGDKYVLKAMLSSNESAPVKGRLAVTAFDGADYKTATPVLTDVQDLTVEAGASVPAECEILVPEVDTLGLKVAFISESGASDAIFVTVPVHKTDQTLTEAHSAVLLAGMDRAALIASLRSQFVNVDASKLEVNEISIIDMVREALPDMFRTDRKDLMSASEALYAGLLARKIDPSTVVDVKGLESKVLACRNDDGGFAWFEGMKSSPVLTAVTLQRLAGLSDKGLVSEIPTLKAMVPDAVRYLDNIYFADTSLPIWRGYISLEQYLFVRSMYTDIPFSAKGVPAKALAAFRKDARAYLVPSKERGLNGLVLAKARRMMTLRNLVSHDGADVWGIGLASDRKMLKSWRADMESLLEYAVAHKSGGMYYPDAVMPWRGLMESELTAHSVLCDLMRDGGVLPDGSEDAAYAERCGAVADGIRLWIMIQKETQQWRSDPAYVDAIASVLDGSDAVLSAKVLALSATYTRPFSAIGAAGNGFTVSRSYQRDGKDLADGDILEVGDRITAKYNIWNEENRSFVLLSVPRPACLRPVDQLSGRIGWWLVTQGYRNVLPDRTEYWYDAYPEEKTTVTEDFYVTQKGVFQTPVVTIESLYAPHYRANGTAEHPMSVR